MKFNYYILAFTILFSASCMSSDKKTQTSIQDLDHLQTAYFASGCFWCVEAIFEELKGVNEVYSGYAGGEIEHPSYKEVSMGKTKHAETVAVYYDSTIISYETLVAVFFGSHDPTTMNRQGPDYGPQYRSIAFYSTEGEKTILSDYIEYLVETKAFTNVITTEIKPFERFYMAEAYHQDFEARNPNHSYIRAVSIPRIMKFKKKFPDLLK